MQIVVPYVKDKTMNNWADFFTKPLKLKVFKKFRDIMMNRPASEIAADP